jgi:hypothetical protein
MQIDVAGGQFPQNRNRFDSEIGAFQQNQPESCGLRDPGNREMGANRCST